MVYSLQLTTDELKRIEAAKSVGINVDIFLKGAIASLPAAQRRRKSVKPVAPQPIPPMPQPRITELQPLPEYTEEQRRKAIAYFEERAKNVILSTCDPKKIDVDVILAAQALTLGATLAVPVTDLLIVTSNAVRLSRFLPADLWQNIRP